MIDDKKINEAANKLCDYGSILSSGYRIDGFKKCAEWMQKEFLKDLWHPIKEKPQKEKLFLYQTSCYGFGLNQIADTKDWSFIIKYHKAIQWLYIEDLLPKTQKGGNHD